MSSIKKPKTYWRSIESLNGVPSSKDFTHREFQDGASELNDVSRRSFLKLMGASAGLAGMSGCGIRRPKQTLVPYAKMPENVTQGHSQYYATSLNVAGDVTGVLVRSYSGRPIKIEGNPFHSSSQGATNVFHQSRLLDLYDPDRMKTVSNNAQPASLRAFKDHILSMSKDLALSKGDGVVFLMDKQVSPSLSYFLFHLKKKYPKMTFLRYEPFNQDVLESVDYDFTGKHRSRIYNFEQANVVMSLDSDFLGIHENQVRYTKSFIARRDSASNNMNRLYVLEPHMTVTGGKADHRFRIKASQMEGFLWRFLQSFLRKKSLPNSTQLINMCRKGILETPLDFDHDVIDLIVADFLKNQGKSLLIAGSRQSEKVHQLVLLLNYYLNNFNKTILFRSPSAESDFFVGQDSLGSIQRLSKMIQQEEVRTLCVIGGNPVYNAPSDLSFSRLLSQVPEVIHLTESFNETSQQSKWVVPLKHDLEMWGDVESGDGSLSIVQPLIRPMWDSLAVLEFIRLFFGKEQSDYALTRQYWRRFYSVDFESKWRRWLHDGVVSGPTKPSNVSRQSVKLDSFISKIELAPNLGSARDDIEIVFSRSTQLFDGRFANNAWLQELPDTVTKMVWDNAALMSQSTAMLLGVNKGDLLGITVGLKEVQIPVFIAPGHADFSVTLPLGYGRQEVGRIGQRTGVDVYPLRSTGSMGYLLNAKFKKSQGAYELVTSQEHGSMEGRAIFREADLEEYKKDPHFAKKGELPEVAPPPLKSLYEEVSYDEGLQWGMSIDLAKCTGCNTCTIACQSENNIPIVGKDEMSNGREMHWIRVDRYFEGNQDDPDMVVQPVTCLQCENAPCEQVCPVAATVHDSEGLNAMVYNRCVGTRYCSDNCPAKVRRFNFFDYNQRNPQSVKKKKVHMFDYLREPDGSIREMMNPDVTVRMRGVMEKCTFCIQRINGTKSTLKASGKTYKDGDIKTACQQACPADAISFGDILDKKSKVSTDKSSNLTYSILEQLHLKARTSYKASVMNPNINIKKVLG